MINRIYVTNFRRIKKADMEIRDGLTCLTGQNGTGKSSVIEAVEFCLYGKTKSGTNKETIRRHGATDDEPTYTSVDFEIGDRHYRCRRYLTRRGSTMASLYAYDQESYKQLRAIDDDTTDLAAGQKDLSDIGTNVATSSTGVTDAIIELFGIRYSGFVASFVARQKELDSLAASQTAENRRKFFLELLNYSRLDTVRAEYNKEIRALKSALEALEKQLISPEETQRQIDATNKDLEVLAGRITKGNATVSQQRAKLEGIDERLTSMSVVSGQLTAAENTLREAQGSLTREQTALGKMEESARILQEESQGYDPQTGVTAQLGAVKREIDKAFAYANQRREREQIAGLISQRQGEIAREQVKVGKLKERTKRPPEVDKANEALADAKSTLGQLTGRKAMLDGEVMKIQGLIDSVSTGQSTSCPTCGTDISSEEGRRHLDNEMAKLTASVTEVSGQIATAQATVRKKEQAVASARRLLMTYQHDMSDLVTAETNLANLTTDLKERTDSLGSKDAYLKEHEGDGRTDLQLADLDARRADLEQKVAKEASMRKAFLELQTTNERISTTRSHIAELTDAVGSSQKFITQHAGLRERYANLQQTRNAESQKLMRFTEALNGLSREQGAKETLRENLIETLGRAREQAKDRASMRSQLETYIGGREVVSFLREFLPAKIAPTLSARASKLLDVATNGMYHMIEIDESYEVSVYTDDDVRPIAMMSGGEQDIISLCIRIAIAEMILSTTGIHKQTLILDEIFGALDDERRASSCRALQSLGTMIPRIICITHIEEIKDLADYTYVVERDEHGVSCVREVVDGTMGTLPRVIGEPISDDSPVMPPKEASAEEPAGNQAEDQAEDTSHDGYDDYDLYPYDEGDRF